MTNILIKHNPFLVETEIIIDDLPIAETSALHKYLKTPMQDWVGDFLPALVEHCNDDELEITFKGLQYNFDDLEVELEAFLKKNRDYDIELNFDASKSQLARFGAIESIVDEINHQSIVPELHEPEFLETLTNASKDKLRVILFGGDDRQRQSFVDDLLGVSLPRSNDELSYCCVDDDSVEGIQIGEESDPFQEFHLDIPFVSSKYCQMRLYVMQNLNTCQNTYYRFVKKGIVAEDNPILICILDENIRKNSIEIMNLISDVYKTRGKKNKWRFIFVSENPPATKRMLNSEFAIKNASVYAVDDVHLIYRRIEEYQNEVCLVHHVTERAHLMDCKLLKLETRISQLAESSKESSKIDSLERKALSLVNQGALKILPISQKEIETKIGIILSQLEDDFAKYCFSKKQYGSELTSTKARSNISDFCEKLPSIIREYTIEQGKTMHYAYSIHLPDNLFKYLEKLNCSSGIDSLSNWTKDKRSVFSTEDYPLVDGYINAINHIYIYIEGKKGALYLTYREILKLSGAEEIINRDGSISHRFQYYDGLSWLLRDKISISGLDTRTITVCKKVFKDEIAKIRPVLISYYDSCNNRGNKVIAPLEVQFEALKAGVENEIKHTAEQLRQEAEISASEQERLIYLQKLRSKIVDLTCL